MARKVDPELCELRALLGAKEYKRTYVNVYQRTRTHGEVRFSGEHYKNSAEKINQLKEKYKNGVPAGTIELMMGLKNGPTA